MKKSSDSQSDKILTVFRQATLLLFGIVIGGGVTIFAVLAGPDFFENVSAIGIIVGTVLFTLSAFFILLRNVLRSQINEKSIGKFNEEYLYPFFDEILSKKLGDENLSIKWSRKTSHLVNNFVSKGVLAWSTWVGASIALAAAVALASSVVSLATVIIGQRQVDRLDSQNRLIGQQIYEATATRVSSVFSAQLPSLLEAIDASRPKNNEQNWEVSAELVARVQAIVDLAEPYASDPETSNWATQILSDKSELSEANWELANTKLLESKNKLFSPERAQLFILLMSMRFPFDNLPVPLDFSQSDFRNIRINRNIALGPNQLASVGETVFTDSNFRNSNIDYIDFSRSDLSGAFFTDYGSRKISNKFIGLPSESRNDVRFLKWLRGANLEGAIVEILYSRTVDESIGYHPNEGNGYFGKLEDSQRSISIDQLWSTADFKNGKVFVYPEQYFIAVHKLSDLITDIGSTYGLALPDNICDPETLTSLQEVAFALRELDQAYVDYLMTMLSDFDKNSAACVSSLRDKSL